MNTRKALADWLDERAAARAAQNRAPAPPAGPPPPEQDRTYAAPNVESSPKTISINREVMDHLEQGKPSIPARRRSFADLWNAMQAPSAAATTKPAQAPQPKFELIRGTGATAPSFDFSPPVGMHDEGLLRRAIGAGKRFDGLALCIGVSDNEGCASTDQDLLRSLGIFIGGLLRNDEFGCRYGNDRFVILCPGRHSTEAQLRLTAISEQLWDYQLRNADRSSLAFTWGGAEIHHESLAEAITEAAERMYETRRTRRVLSVDMLRSQSRAAAV